MNSLIILGVSRQISGWIDTQRVSNGHGGEEGVSVRKLARDVR